MRKMRKLIIILLVIFLGPVLVIPAVQFWQAFTSSFSTEFSAAYQGAQVCKAKGYTFDQARQLNFQCH
jgi:hypothetical protein